MVELLVLSASRSATADAEAEQKGHHKGAHPECGIGGHKFPLVETGPATTRLRECSASRLRRTRLQRPGVGGSAYRRRINLSA